jgi:cobalt-zinc-cadmium efflux system membrane fusion protein
MKAGTEVTAIENTDFIILQQDYLEARNLFDFYKEEYARQGDLTVENATSLKKMQIARRDYQSAELKYNALSMQLTILGVYPDSLQPDQLISALPVNAPRSGIVSQTYIQSGTYVEKGQLLFEMVSKQHVLIKIQVPEASFKSIEEGQMVNCRPAFDSLATLIATIRSIVPRIDPENHMATVYASLSDQSSGIVPGMSVDVMIHAGKDTLHLISPGIIQTDRNGQFIVVREKGAYLKVPVEPELTIDGKTGISGLPHELSDSLVIAGFKQLGPLRILK